jgi:hypothetical protein
VKVRSQDKASSSWSGMGLKIMTRWKKKAGQNQLTAVTMFCSVPLLLLLSKVD